MFKTNCHNCPSKFNLLNAVFQVHSAPVTRTTYASADDLAHRLSFQRGCHLASFSEVGNRCRHVGGCSAHRHAKSRVNGPRVPSASARLEPHRRDRRCASMLSSGRAKAESMFAITIYCYCLCLHQTDWDLRYCVGEDFYNVKITGIIISVQIRFRGHHF